MKITALFVGLLLSLAAARAAESPLQIDQAKSSMEVDVKATGHSFVGKVSPFTATVTVDPATGRVVHVQVNVHFANVNTSNAKRDGDMLKWENADQFPEVVYTLTSLTADKDVTFKSTGTLLLHGKAKDIAFPVTIKTTDKIAYEIDGEATINTEDFGLPVIRKYLIAKVDPIVKVRFHLLGKVTAK